MNIFGRGVQVRIRRVLRFLPLVAVIISGLVFIANYKLQAAAADVSSNFTVVEAHAYKDNAETQEINETQGIAPGAGNYFKIKLKWKYESENPIADGDTVTFPLANNTATSTSRLINNPGMSKQDIIDEDGEKIGEWEIKSKQVTIRFTGGAVGRYSLEGILTTPRNCYFGGIWKNDMVVPVTVGNYTLNILIPGSAMLPAQGDGATKYSGARTNRSVKWGFYSPGITMNELYRGEGQVALSGAARLSNIIIEDTFDESVKSVSVDTIRARATIPRDWLNGTHGGSGWGIEASLMKFFTKKTQTAGQSFADFKASLGEHEYGIYTNEETGRISIAINIGSQPSDITFAEALRMYGSANASMGQQYLSETPFATSDIGDAIDRLTGPSNVLGGAVFFFAVGVTANYDQVSINTPVTNMATFSYDNANGDHISVQKTATSELSVGSSISEIKGEAKLYLRDVATKLPISGARLKLQVQDGETWVDVENGEKTTGTDGSVQVLSLDSGAKYRWVQTGYTDHYLTDSFKLYSDEAMTRVIEEFTMPENTGVTTYATNEKESFNITYKAGEHGDFSDIVFSNQYYGATTPQPTTEQIKAVAGWSFVGWNPSVDNIVTGEATYVAQWQRQTKAESVSIIWVDSDNQYGTRPDSVSVQLKQDGEDYGDAVSISADDRWAKTWSGLPVYNDDGTQQHEYDAINVDPVPGYTATVGRATNGTITITFKINQHTEILGSKIEISAPEIVDNKTAVVDYEVKYSANIKDYIGKVDINISVKLPYPISVDESELDGGIYDKDTQTITWVVSKNHNTYTNGEVITLGYNVSLIYEGAKAKDQLLATAESTITLEDKDNHAADSAETIIKTPSKIVFRYIDENGVEIQREQIEDGFVGDVSDNTPPEIPGYRLIREETDLAFGEEEHVVIYRYEKMSEPVNPMTLDDSIAKYFILIGVLISGLGCGGYLISRRKA